MTVGAEAGGEGRIPGSELPDDVTRHPLLGRLAEELAVRKRRQARLPGFRAASVLIPLVLRDGDLHVTFIQRTEDGSTHSGQIAFPGGAREDEDADAIATALREAEEEVNIRRDTVTPLGRMDDNATISRYVVTPVVGVVREIPDYRPDEREVQNIFEVPLDFLLDHANERRAPDTEFMGRTWALYEYHWEGRVIWGVTGRIVHEFMTVVRALTVSGDNTP